MGQNDRDCSGAGQRDEYLPAETGPSRSETGTFPKLTPRTFAEEEEEPVPVQEFEPVPVMEQLPAPYPPQTYGPPPSYDPRTQPLLPPAHAPYPPDAADPHVHGYGAQRAHGAAPPLPFNGLLPVSMEPGPMQPPLSAPPMVDDDLAGGPLVAESSDMLTTDWLLHGRRVPPGPGWRRTVFKATGGLVRVGESEANLRRRDLVNRVRTPVAGGHHRVAIMSLKGGVG